MEYDMIGALVCAAVVIAGAIGTMIQVYQITLIDAKARGLKHPKLWGMIAMNGNQSGGLILYLIKRRNYPILSIKEEERNQIQVRKKKAGVCILFLACGAIGMVISISLL